MKAQAASTIPAPSPAKGACEGDEPEGAVCQGFLIRSPMPRTIDTKPTPPGLAFEVLRDGAGMRRLGAHWDGLLDRSGVRTPFMRWDWAELWWKEFGGDYRAVFGAAWEADGTLAALVPLVIGPGNTATRRRLRQLAYFGGLGEVVAEGLDCMALPGREGVLEPLMDRVFGEIRRDWDMAHFGFADEGSPYFGALRRALERHGEEVREGNRQASPVIRLEGRDWTEYLMERTGSFRKKYRRISMIAGTERGMCFREARRAEEAGPFMEQLFELHGSRWTEEQSLFLSPRARAFHRGLAERWVGTERAVVLLMDFDGEPVAANYAFLEDGRMWDYQGGWRKEHIELSPAKLINAENIRRAMERGVREIDMLPGDVEYKSKWTRERREVVDLEAVNPESVRARVFHSVRTVKRALESLFPGVSLKA
jgi:CelD/BcsL family acetyltransferase involved in cellulose biosynthesis